MVVTAGSDCAAHWAHMRAVRRCVCIENHQASVPRALALLGVGWLALAPARRSGTQERAAELAARADDGLVQDQVEQFLEGLAGKLDCKRGGKKKASQHFP